MHAFEVVTLHRLGGLAGQIGNTPLSLGYRTVQLLQALVKT